MQSGIQIGSLLFAVLLIGALLLVPAAERLRLPAAAVLVAAGFLGSELLVGLGFDLGLRWDDFRDLILYVLVPLLVFSGALTIDLRSLARNLWLIAVLAIPVYLVTVAISATALYWGVGDPAGFPWLTALITGSLIAATDPGAITNVLRKAGVPERLLMVLEGESLFNDAFAIVLFNSLLALALAPASAASLDWSSVIQELASVLLGGIAVGTLVGFLARHGYRRCRDQRGQAIISIAAAYLSYSVAETLLNVSGIMAVLLAGLWMSAAIRPEETDSSRFVQALWELAAYMAGALAFMLLGITVTTAMFTRQWQVMLVAIGAITLARVLAVYGLLPLLTPAGSVSGRDRALLVGGNLRGAVTAALALSLPVELDGWWVGQAAGYGVVLFTLFVQATAVSASRRSFLG